MGFFSSYCIKHIPFHGYVKNAVLSLKKSFIDPLLFEPYSFSGIQKYKNTGIIHNI